MRFASLGSGSKGNATLVECVDTRLLIDCGFSARETVRRLALLGLEPEQLSAILVTHEHSDHCAGVAVLARKYHLPVYMTHGTYRTGRCGEIADINTFNCGTDFELGGVEIATVAVPHDAKEPCQYVFRAAGKTLGVLTDLGSITPTVVSAYQRCDALLLEFNHDQKMLMEGPYPESLKRRVDSDWGHLNNQQSADILGQIDTQNLQHLVVAHVSDKNNCPTLARDIAITSCEINGEVFVADQENGFSWLSLS